MQVSRFCLILILHAYTVAQDQQGCQIEVDLVFIMDASGSMGDRNFAMCLEFLKEVVNSLDIENGPVRVGMMVYSDQPFPVFHLGNYTNDKAGVVLGVSSARYLRGSTNTAAALRYLYTDMFTVGNGDRDNVLNTAVIFTDGESNDPKITIMEAYEAKSKGIHIIVVALGDWLNQEELKGIASYPHSRNKIDVFKFEDLILFREMLHDLVCNNVNECVERPCQNGGFAVDYSGGCTCRCRNPWGGPTCQDRCDIGSADVVFALDASGSMGRSDFQAQLDIVKSVISGLNIGSEIRIGLLTFASDVQVAFHLNTFNSKTMVLNALSIYYPGGSTNTAAAIEISANDMFQFQSGDRSSAPNKLIIMTDGMSNNYTATVEAAMRARTRTENPIQIIAIGVGSGVDVEELKAMASDPISSNVLTADTWENLTESLTTITQGICNSGCSNSPLECMNGGSPVSSGAGCRCHCVEGYRGNRCQYACTGALDITMIIDSSGSIRNERFPYVLDFIVDILEQFHLESEGGQTRIAGIHFSDEAYLDFNLSKYKTKNDVTSAIKHIKFLGGKTHTASALQLLMNSVMGQDGDRADIPDVVLLFTDGASNIEAAMTIPLAIEVRQRGTHIIVFGVGEANMLELNAIASRPHKQTLFFEDSYTGLPSRLPSLISSTCNDVNECSSNPCVNGGRCIDGLKYYYCDCPRGYSGVNCQRSCNRQMDICFVLDLSASISIVRDIVIDFAYALVMGLPVDNDVVRVSVVSFSDNAVVNFDLNSISSKRGVLNALSFNHANKHTGTAKALQLLTTDVFLNNAGDRDGVPNKAIVISDGWSNINEDQTIQRANEARDNNIQIYSILVGEFPNYAEMNSIANEPLSEHTLRLAKSEEVQGAAEELLNRICT